MLVVLRFKSAPEVPTEKSTTRVVPLDCTKDPHVAVPVAPAVADVIELAVKTPDAAPDANVELKANVANNVFPDTAVSGLVGCVPV